MDRMKLVSVDGVQMIRVGDRLIEKANASRSLDELRRRLSALAASRQAIDGDALLARAQGELDAQIAKLTERRAKLSKAEVVAAAENRIDGYIAATSKTADELESLVGQLER